MRPTILLVNETDNLVYQIEISKNQCAGLTDYAGNYGGKRQVMVRRSFAVGELVHRCGQDVSLQLENQ